MTGLRSEIPRFQTTANTAKDGKVQWSVATRDFGRRPERGARIDAWTEAHAFFKTGVAAPEPETVSASAWLEDADDEEHIVEHVLGMPDIGVALSLLWRTSPARE